MFLKVYKLLNHGLSSSEFNISGEHRFLDWKFLELPYQEQGGLEIKKIRSVGGKLMDVHVNRSLGSEFHQNCLDKSFHLKKQQFQHNIFWQSKLFTSERRSAFGHFLNFIIFVFTSFIFYFWVQITIFYDYYILSMLILLSG